MPNNIIFYFTDQQRWETCGCFGQPLDITPNLDKLAQEGVKFDNAFSPQPVCGPCRALFQTGDENRVEYDIRNRADHAADHGLLARAFRAHNEAGCRRPDDERCAERDVNRVAAGKLKCACVRAEQVQDGRGEAQQYGGKRCADDQARP